TSCRRANSRRACGRMCSPPSPSAPSRRRCCRAGCSAASSTLNRPAAIRHVLIDNAENYRRTAATVRLLYPIVGRGLFLAEGEDWREQRRSVAPSFAPRTLPLLARHVAGVADELAADLAAAADGEVDLLDKMHRLAIEVAGRAMFSLEMDAFAPRMRAMLRDYGERLAQPSVV